MNQQFKIKNHTAFAYFWNLANTIKTFVYNPKDEVDDEKTLKKANDYVECLEALGKVAFGENEYYNFKKRNKDVPNLSKSRRVKKA
jgi:hypothetical protein